MESKTQFETRYAEMMEKVKAMPLGGNLEELFLREFADLKNLAYREAVGERAGAADEADFPPSAMRRL